MCKLVSQIASACNVAAGRALGSELQIALSVGSSKGASVRCCCSVLWLIELQKVASILKSLPGLPSMARLCAPESMTHSTTPIACHSKASPADGSTVGGHPVSR